MAKVPMFPAAVQRILDPKGIASLPLDKLPARRFDHATQGFETPCKPWNEPAQKRYPCGTMVQWPIPWTNR